VQRHDACTNDAVMGHRVRPESASGVEIAVGSSRVFALILAMGTLASGDRHDPGATSSAVVRLMGCGAAICLFASLVVHAISHGALES
jgi:hypothetical protein